VTWTTLRVGQQMAGDAAADEVAILAGQGRAGLA